MTTFGDFSNRLLHALGAEANTTYSPDLIWESCVNALNAILPWCPNLQVATLTVLANTKTVALPSGCWRIEAVQDDTTGLIMPRFDLRPGQVRRNASDRKNFSDWMEYPKGSVYLSNATETDKTLTVYYIATWAKPANKADTTFVIPAPEGAMTGMVYYAASHCLVPGSVNSAQIRQFNTKVDSGTPVDNSLEVEAKFLRLLFIEEMKSLPKYVGAIQ